MLHLCTVLLQSCCCGAGEWVNHQTNSTLRCSDSAITDEHASKQKGVSTTSEGLQHAQGHVAILGFQFPKGIAALSFLTKKCLVLILV